MEKIDLFLQYFSSLHGEKPGPLSNGCPKGILWPVEDNPERSSHDDLVGIS